MNYLTIMVSTLMKILSNIRNCKSKNCVGYIVREGSRWRIKKKGKKLIMKNIIYNNSRSLLCRYSGDVIRSLKILKLLKKHSLTLICLKNDIKKLKEKNFIYFKNPNFFKIFCLFSLLKLEPIHFGLFFLKK